MERLYRPPLPASETHSLAEPLAKIPILRGAAKREGPDTAVRKSRSAQSEGGEGENLIFLISQPRAGSTMLQKVLGSHPEIHTVSEPWVALPPLFALREKGIAADYDAALARAAISGFLGALPEGENAYWEAVRRMLNHLYGRALAEAGKRIFLDKTPRYYFVISELRRVFPRARFLFLLRNPLAVLASIVETWVKTDDPMQLRNLRHDLMAAPSLLLEGISSCGPSAIVARYEELTSQPEKAIRRLCRQLGIEFHPGMIEYGAGFGGERWPFGDQGTVYRESRPVPGYAERWRSVLKQSPVREGWARSYIEALGPDVVRELGYDYTALRADFSALPAGGDWEAITRSDSEAQALLRGQWERAVDTVNRQEQRAALLEAAAAERLAGLQEKDDALIGLHAELAIRDAALAEARSQLERAVDTVNRQEQRAALLEATAAERLAGLQEKDDALISLHAELAIRDAALAEARSQLERAADVKRQQDKP